jgi:hemerythrin-like domain-containing protein
MLRGVSHAGEDIRMKATDQLKNEHEGILLMLRILAQIISTAASGGKIITEHLNGIIGFLKIFVDNCHHGKEEDLLFPAMEEAGIRREGGPIGMMLAEHERGRGYIKGMSGALHRAQGCTRTRRAMLRITPGRRFTTTIDGVNCR